jgi:hypothetical protein
LAQTFISGSPEYAFWLDRYRLLSVAGDAGVCFAAALSISVPVLLPGPVEMLVGAIVRSTPAMMIVIRRALVLTARIMPVGRPVMHRLIGFRPIAMVRH